MAEVSTTKPPLVVQTTQTTTITSVYFEENSSTLSGESIEQINEFLRANPDLTNITVVGNTDGCGAPTHNVALSGRRASSVRSAILRIRSANIDTRWAGEIVANHSESARRVDIIATEEVSLSEPPPRIIADFYLIDGSGSMAGGDWQKYTRSVAFHRPRGSRVFVSTTSCIRRGRNLNAINPGGATEIWYSYWTVLDHMSEGETLVIISDFDSTYPLLTWERDSIARKVAEAGVTVRTIRP